MKGPCYNILEWNKGAELIFKGKKLLVRTAQKKSNAHFAMSTCTSIFFGATCQEFMTRSHPA
jgi:hypothetical protein